MNTKRLNSSAFLWFTLLITFILKFTISFNTALFEDEALYWNWSLSPDPSYSFTTLVSIKFFTLIFGNGSELFIRLPAIISNFLILAILFKIGKLLNTGNTRILLCSVLFFSVPFVTVYTSFISPDSMLLLFSVASIYIVIKIIKFNKTADWIFCGFNLGLLLLSKYTGIIYFLIILLYLTLNKKIFNTEFGKNLLLLIFTYLITISPLIYWNLNHDPVWLNHYLLTDADKVFAGYSDLLKAFFLSQFAILLPFIFILILSIIRNILISKNKTYQEYFLLFLFSAMLMTFVIISLSGKIKGNWFFIMYIPLLISVMLVSYGRYFKILLTISATVNILMLVILNLPPSEIKFIADNRFGKYVNNSFQYYWPGHSSDVNNDHSWVERILKMKTRKSDLASIKEEIDGSHFDYDFIAADNFNLSSLLQYYLETGEKIYVLNDLRFKFLNSAETNSKLTGQNALLISYKGSGTDYWKSKFEKIRILNSINYELAKKSENHYGISFGENFNPPRSSKK